MEYSVYILPSNTNATVYTGVTNNLLRRVFEHKNKIDPNSFTAKYNVQKLVYYEMTSDFTAAIKREKQIKSWKRKQKNDLVTDFNPTWKDLYPEICE